MRIVIGIALVVMLAGCGEEQPTSSPAVIEAKPIANPYDGPMSSSPDFSDDATPIDQAGAAGQALECDGDVYAGGGGDYVDGGLESVQNSPERALQNWLENESGFMALPQTDYFIERDDGDRVLMSFDIDGRTKVAFIAADGIHDWNDETGWGIESWGQCDPSELGAEVAEGANVGVWQDASGAPVPVSKIESFQGPEHCDWQDITFLYVGPLPDRDQYLRDVQGQLADSLKTTYKAGVRLPANATDSGYQRDGQELWVVPSKNAAYLVRVDNPDDVERWPAPKTPIGCD